MLKNARDIYGYIRPRFSYVYDRDQYPDRFDHWDYKLEDHSLLGKVLYDDCDGFAMWGADLARENGLDWRAITCFVPSRTGLGGHAILYLPEEGLCIDNIQPGPFAPSAPGYVYGNPKPGWQAKISDTNSIAQWHELDGWA